MQAAPLRRTGPAPAAGRLRHGADSALKDETSNGSALDVARRGGNAELIALPTQAGPRP
jgi:hypothetical protein